MSLLAAALRSAPMAHVEAWIQERLEGLVPGEHRVQVVQDVSSTDPLRVQVGLRCSCGYKEVRRVWLLDEKGRDTVTALLDACLAWHLAQNDTSLAELTSWGWFDAEASA